ncbi:MAG: hypothetical protein AMDU1_APLC00070G0001 [Thermoplasmatales archaeon A-plasma]|jgi:hypothetical protein|nr:MAG: hypothetical protein AMDU1_APLC00070G0001 [Thermoplasmatales archaeon A-plasma]
MNKAVKPDYIAHEIALNVQYYNIFRDKKTCLLDCAAHFFSVNQKINQTI